MPSARTSTWKKESPTVPRPDRNRVRGHQRPAPGKDVGEHSLGHQDEETLIWLVMEPEVGRLLSDPVWAH